MTFEQLKEIIDKNNIPYNVTLESDSGWECDATDMDGVYYNRQKNLIIFTQSISQFERYDPRYRIPKSDPPKVHEKYTGFIAVSEE